MAIQAQPCTMAGTYTIGPTGNYPTLTAAITALRTTGLGDAVILELQPTYVSSAETFPITFNNIPCISQARTITVRPETGATNRVITSTSSVATISLADARYITFDGRPGGVGTAKQLTISNTASSGTGPAVLFVNDASFNQLLHLKLQGQSYSAVTGVVFFSGSTASVTNGNNNNLIQQCDISNASFYPIHGIYSSGSANKKNSNNQVLNCNIFNFANTNGYITGIRLAANSQAWTITGNSIYHTIQFNVGNTLVEGIAITDTTSSGFVIDGNFFGGNAPNSAGTRLTYGSYYQPINLQVGRTGYTMVRNNQIANIGYNMTSGGPCAAIELGMGKFICSGNTIGSQTVANSINIRLSQFFSYYGIVMGTTAINGGVDSCFIQNNIISGISISQNTPGIFDGSAIGIYVRQQKRGYAEITGNTIGNPANLIGIYNDTYPDDRDAIGIMAEAESTIPAAQLPINNISNNTIVNLYGKPTGIRLRYGRHQVSNNSITRLHTLPDNQGFTLPAKGIVTGLVGMAQISGNTIQNLRSIGNHVDVVGIEIAASQGITVERNVIHGLQTGSTAVNNIIRGINIDQFGGFKIWNNMIRLGIDTSGNPVTGNQQIYGIYQNCDTASILHNSVYIGGSGTGESAAYYTTSGIANPGSIYNNILVNARSASSGSQGHFAVKFANANINLGRLNYNIYHATGTNGFLGSYKGINHGTIAAWRTAARADSNSFFYNPNFVNATGNSATVNLHLANPTTAEGTGTALATLPTDADGDSRAANGPVDIGADAGNFTLQDGDAPVITHINFLGQVVNSSFTYQATITDNGGGVDTAGNTKPRMWLRKNFPTTSGWVSVQGSLATGSTGNGNWQFTVDLATLGIALAPGDLMDYYFVAQDKGPVINMGYSNTNGTQHSSVNTQVSAPTNSLQLLIYGYFPDTVYVGSGQTYTSLSSNGGFFEAAKKYTFNPAATNARVIITSNLTAETGTHLYSTFDTMAPVVTICTHTAVEKMIRNGSNLNNTMIELNNARNIIIDGSVNGSGRYLRFSNTNANPVNGRNTMGIYDYCHNLQIKNCIFQANGNGTGFTTSSAAVMVIGANTTNRNRFIRLENNWITGVEPTDPGTAGLPPIGLAVFPSNGDSLTFKNNDITNFTQYGIDAFNSGTVTGKLVIDSNHFYHNSAFAAANFKTVIQAEGRMGGCSITNNHIGGSARFCGGGPWTFNAGGGNFKGIRIVYYNDAIASIQNNTINNLRFTVPFGYNFMGMDMAANTRAQIGNLQGNTIGSTTAADGIYVLGQAAGIYARINLPTGNLPRVLMENNRLMGFTGWYVRGIDFEGSNAWIRKNLVTKLTAIGINSNGAGFEGMALAMGSGLVESNTIHDITGQVVNTGFVSGITARQTSNNSLELVLARNRIYNLKTVANQIYPLMGIRLQGGTVLTHNNQISLGSGTGNDLVGIAGIFIENPSLSVATHRNRLYYNSIYIGGQEGNGAYGSAAVQLVSGSPLRFFKNNLLYNARTGGSGSHLAMRQLQTGAAPMLWPGFNADHNLYITADTTAVNEWIDSGIVNIRRWRTLSKSDTASYAARVADVPGDSLLAAAGQGNLNIRNDNSVCWYVNGKALPVAGIDSDFDSALVRSTAVANGATDIGADEFNTLTLPPNLIVSGNRAAGSTQWLSFNGRTVASITWGNNGTPPLLGNARWYTGSWPNDTAASSGQHLNNYLQLPVSGGNGYSYSLTMHYDSSMLGRITDMAQAAINKKQIDVDGTWQLILPTVANTSAKTLTINNQTSFSEFTATNAAQPMGPGPSTLCKGGSTSFTMPSPGVGFSYQWQVDTGSGFGNLLPDAVHSNVTDSVLQITHAPTTLYGRVYRCMATNGANTVVGNPITLRFVAVWTGGLNQDWQDANNWGCGQLPDANTDVVINGNAVNMPLVNATGYCRSLKLLPTANIQVAAGASVVITGR
jgi:hypothetical protein